MIIEYTDESFLSNINQIGKYLTTYIGANGEIYIVLDRSTRYQLHSIGYVHLFMHTLVVVDVLIITACRKNLFLYSEYPRVVQSNN